MLVSPWTGHQSVSCLTYNDLQRATFLTLTFDLTLDQVLTIKVNELHGGDQHTERSKWLTYKFHVFFYFTVAEFASDKDLFFLKSQTGEKNTVIKP